MESYRYTPKRIAEEGVHFSIPLYQRLFTWEKEEIEGLLHDLKEHFVAHQDDPYYIGVLSCAETQRGTYDLIDGQQRVTVVVLMGVALRTYDEEWNHFLKDEGRLRFVSRTKDNKYLREAIETPSQDRGQNVRMAEGIRVIKTFVESEFASDEERKCFAERVYRKLSFFLSVLPPSYAQDPKALNRYFEAMNSGGKELEEHEILKVKLLEGVDEKEDLTGVWNAVCDLDQPIIRRDKRDTDDSYGNRYKEALRLCRAGEYEEAFERCTGIQDAQDSKEIGEIEAQQHSFDRSLEGAGERCLITIPEFLRLVLDLYLGLRGSYSFYRTGLLKLYREHSIEDKQSFYHLLLFCRLLIDYYIVYKDGKGGANSYEIVFRDGRSADALRQYESMLYVAQVPIYDWLRPALEGLLATPAESTGQLLRSIKATDNAHHDLPKLEQMTYPNVDRYWFWRLDYYLWERRDEYFSRAEIVDEYVFRANRSIEHLHPQDQSSNEEWSEEDLHSFGNLAMISPSFNSQQSNDSVEVKFARIEEHVRSHSLQSLKMYLMYSVAQELPSGDL